LAIASKTNWSLQVLKLQRVSDFRLPDVPAAVFICAKCHKLFSSNDAVRQHLPSCIASAQLPLECLDLLAESTSECQYCGLHASNMSAHTKFHSTPIPGLLKCAYSGCKNIFFSSSEQLKKHLVVHQKHMKFYCSVCGRFFNSSLNLYKHRRTHTELTHLICDVPGCDYIGNAASELQLHYNSDHLNNALTCSYCCSDFDSDIALDWHMLSHKTHRPGVFKCVYWNCASLKFTSIVDLKRHVLKKHPISNKFACDVCASSFVSLGILAMHKMQHAPKVPEELFPCTVADCNYSCNMDTDLQLHMLTVHNATACMCKYCSRIFKNFTSLNLHMSKHETNQEGVFTCVYKNCDSVTFPSIFDLQNHVKVKHPIANKILFFDVCGSILQVEKPLRRTRSVATDPLQSPPV
jgi:Zinc finger, C2H2 type/C2H2-type zinc finger